MKRFYARKKEICPSAGGVSKAAFCLGALNRVLQSTLVVAACTALGFAFGVGSTVITIKAQMRETAVNGGLDSLTKLIEEHRAIESKIEDCIRRAVQEKLVGEDGSPSGAVSK